MNKWSQTVKWKPQVWPILLFVICQYWSSPLFSISVLKLAAGLIKIEGDSSPSCCCVIHWFDCCILSVRLVLLIQLVYASIQTVASSNIKMKCLLLTVSAAASWSRRDKISCTYHPTTQNHQYIQISMYLLHPMYEC